MLGALAAVGVVAFAFSWWSAGREKPASRLNYDGFRDRNDARVRRLTPGVGGYGSSEDFNKHR